ncbi:MAG: hypothetical protein F4X98_02535 [Gammaproteobacteria bacterium]|nr:hypothetical protein [Gammaproteobacteria bacterium]
MSVVEIYMVIGFLLAAYSVVANDSIQTLGTFLASNAQRPWWVLWMFAGSIMLAVIFYSWFVNDGDPAYGLLDKFPEPIGGISWLHAIPPLALLILTRLGVPVSTTFLVLTVFAVTGGETSNIAKMLTKSALGYVVAFVAAIGLFALVFKRASEYFHRTKGDTIPTYWVVLQWASTGFLWSMWLIQDLANIFVYLPRQLSVSWLVFGIITLLAMQGYIFYRFGGAIQKIVTSKTDTTDIRAATIIDFIYGLVLLVFKFMLPWVSPDLNIPMSTTWVFLGVLAGREFALSFYLSDTSTRGTVSKVMSDALKALSGLVVSVVLAFGLPWLYNLMVL